MFYFTSSISRHHLVEYLATCTLGPYIIDGKISLIVDSSNTGFFSAIDDVVQAPFINDLFEGTTIWTDNNPITKNTYYRVVIESTKAADKVWRKAGLSGT